MLSIVGLLFALVFAVPNAVLAQKNKGKDAKNLVPQATAEDYALLAGSLAGCYYPYPYGYYGYNAYPAVPTDATQRALAPPNGTASPPGSPAPSGPPAQYSQAVPPGAPYPPPLQPAPPPPYVAPAYYPAYYPAYPGWYGWPGWWGPSLSLSFGCCGRGWHGHH